MDVTAYAIFLFFLAVASFVPPLARHRLAFACAFVLGSFLFLLARSLETVAVVFLVSTILAAFAFRESFSVIDYRKRSGEAERANAFFRANRFRFLGAFVAFHAAFFGIFFALKSELLEPGGSPALPTRDLGEYLGRHHWVAALAVCVATAVLLNVNGRRSR